MCVNKSYLTCILGILFFTACNGYDVIGDMRRKSSRRSVMERESECRESQRESRQERKSIADREPQKSASSRRSIGNYEI